MQPMTIAGRGDRHVDVVRIERDGPAACGGVGRMRPQVAQMGEPGTVLSFEPVQVTVREESGDADFLRSVGLGRQGLVGPRRHVVAEVAKPFGPSPVLAGEIEPDAEAWEHAFIAGKARVVWRLDDARIDSLVRVPEQRGIEPGPAPGPRQVVQPVVERRAVRDDPVVHLIGAGVEAGSPWGTGRGLAVVAIEPHTRRGETIEVGCADQLMAGSREAIAAELVECHQEKVQSASRGGDRQSRLERTACRCAVAGQARPVAGDLWPSESAE